MIPFVLSAFFRPPGRKRTSLSLPTRLPLRMMTVMEMMMEMKATCQLAMLARGNQNTSPRRRPNEVALRGIPSRKNERRPLQKRRVRRRSEKGHRRGNLRLDTRHRGAKQMQELLPGNRPKVERRKTVLGNLKTIRCSSCHQSRRKLRRSGNLRVHGRRSRNVKQRPRWAPRPERKIPQRQREDGGNLLQPRHRAKARGVLRAVETKRRETRSATKNWQRF